MVQSLSVSDNLSIINGLPLGLEKLTASELYRLLPGPTLIEIPGRKDPPLFVSVLLHGNETGGWEALRQLLALLGDQPPDRALCLFIGNVRAAREGVRHLPDQPDFNRVWNGGPKHALADAAREVTEYMRTRGAFASLDFHNNSGVNPLHVCVSALCRDTVRVASLFAPISVLVEYPTGIQCAAFSAFCPAVTLEAGKPGDSNGVAKCLDLLNAMLSIDAIEDIATGDGREASLYASTARIELPERCNFAFSSLPFGDDAADITLASDMEARNFHHLPAGTLFASVPQGKEIPLFIVSRQGEIDTDRYFSRHGSQVRFARDVILSMYTSNSTSVRQDCLCYLMEPIKLRAVGN